MPVVDPTDLVEQIEQPPKVQIAAPEYRGVTVDTRYVPQSALLTHLEGSPWTVNYYSQVLGEDNAVAGQNVTREAIYQQYRLIKGFELKVTQPLQQTQDPVSKSMTQTGMANIYPFVIPNVGDMFLADIGDGREGLFKITSSERRSIYKESAYVIEYMWIDYSTPARRNDLGAKTIQTLYFVRDFLMHGQNPLLVQEDYEQAQQLAERYHEMAAVYFGAFTSDEYRTLLAPAQVGPTYDHFLTMAVKSHFSTWDAKELRQLRTLNCGGDNAMRSLTVWEVLSQRNPRLLRGAARRMGLVGARTFAKPSDPMMEGIYWSGISYVLYPKDPTINVNLEEVVLTTPTMEEYLVDSPSRISNLSDLLTPTELAGLPYDNAPLIHAVLKDDHYIFSKAFYERTEGQSKLELAVHDYLERRQINPKLLLSFCDTYHAWGGLERFYYMPIVLLLIKATIRSL
ncbi:hypothetical protein D3C71_79460 [compost metagenome]